MRIAFIHNGNAYLPGIAVYMRHFNSLGFSCERVHQKAFNPHDYAIHWYFMGINTRKAPKDKMVIHEYASASVPPFARWKNALKRRLSIKPSLRIFLNDYVREQFSFRDTVPFLYRDIGIEPAISAAGPAEKMADFIYSGAVTRDMKMEKLLDVFARGALRSKTLLLLGSRNRALEQEYGSFVNIRFHEPVKAEAVPAFLQRASYGINFKPNCSPYAGQTSTKFLEYLNYGLPVITTDSPWIQNFINTYGGNYFILKPDLSNLTWEAVEAFNFSTPSLEEWTWDKQLSRSGITELLLSYKATGRLPDNIRVNN